MENENEDENINKDKRKDRVVGEEYFTLWNTKMPWKLKELTGKRLTSLKERLKQQSFVDGFALVLDKILASDFLSGRKPSETHKNFKADFDWVISNDTNYIKVLEGKYDDIKKTGIEKWEIKK